LATEIDALSTPPLAAAARQSVSEPSLLRTTWPLMVIAFFRKVGSTARLKRSLIMGRVPTRLPVAAVSRPLQMSRTSPWTSETTVW
jgi:hypothetical protein